MEETRRTMEMNGEIYLKEDFITNEDGEVIP